MSQLPPSDGTRSVAPVPAWKRLYRWFGSLQLAVIVLSSLSAALIAATVVEKYHGRDYALWHCYQSPWFMALILLLSLNILVSMLLRFPWGWRRIGFLCTHVGLLMLLAGAVVTFGYGIEGTLQVEEGQSANSIWLPDRNRFEVRWLRGRDAAYKHAFTFRPGPDDWPEGKTLDLEDQGGVRLRVLRYLQHAEVESVWAADASADAAAALQWSVRRSDGPAMQSGWMAAAPIGQPVGDAEHGRIEFQSAPAATMLEDLLRPPPADADKEGVLSVHYDGATNRLPVSASRGKRIPLGDGKTSVEIAEYLPNSAAASPQKPGAGGGDNATPPAVSVRIYSSGSDAPTQQLALAGEPFARQGTEGLRRSAASVKLWYHHPAAKAPKAVQFVQFPDGALYCRTGRNGAWEKPVPAKPGFETPLDANLTLRLEAHLPKAVQKNEARPVSRGNPADEDVARPAPAALVEITAGGAKEEVWLSRGAGATSVHEMTTPKGGLVIDFGPDKEPLGFDVQLVRFERTLNPGGMGDAGYASTVRVGRRGENRPEREIAMNRPLYYDRFVFYQSGFNEKGRRPSTILSASYDPGRLLKYVGSFVLCVGMAIVMIQQGRRMSRQGEQAAPAAGAPEGR